MAIDTTLVSLFRTLMESYNSDIDTSDKSAFYVQVMEPLLTRVGGDLIESNSETFLADFVSERYPDLDTSEFSGIRDLVIRPMATMLEPIKREINYIRTTQSFTNYESMTTDELNALLSNFFLEKNTGGYATGTVRVYFPRPTDVNTSGASFYTTSGLLYIPQTNVVFTAAQMSFNVSSNRFYIDVVVVSSEAGAGFNVPVNSIVTVEGIVGATSCSNITAVTGGANPETNEEAIARARNSVTIQNLVTKNGINYVLTTNFSGIEDIAVIGFGESDMIRDIVSGPSLVSGVPGGVLTQTTNVIPTNGLHIGGKTDIYAYDSTTTGQISKSLSIDNITDAGILLLQGQSGYITATSAPQTFYDRTGYFDIRNIEVGDYLYTGSSSHRITAVSSDNVVLATAIPSISSSISYEIRRLSLDGTVRIPLHNLSALETTGLTAISATSSTTPSQPIPGSLSLAPLQNGLGNVAKTENVVQIVDSSSSGNIVLPLFNVSTVQLGAGSGAYTDLGKIPLAEVLEVTAPSGFTGADNSTGIAIGKLRVYTRDKINILAIPTAQSTTDGSSASYNALSVERNGNHTDAVTGQKYTGPIYANGIYKYGIQPVHQDSSETNPWTWSNEYQGVLNASPSSDTGLTGIANGNYFYIDRSVSYATPPSAGMWVYNSGYSNNRKYELMQIISVEEVSGTKADGYTSGDLYYECQVRSEDVTVPEFEGSGADSFFLYQGFLGEDLQYDSIYNIYYADFEAYCLNSNVTDSNISSSAEITLTRHVNTYDNSGTAKYVPFSDGLGGDNHDFYLEGYKVRSLARGYAFSTKEQPYLLLTNFVTLLDSSNVASSSSNDLSDTGISFAMKLSYITGATVSAIQDFVDLDENRIVAEDILIKPFLPAIPFGSITGKGLTAIQGNTLIKSYLAQLTSSETLELSDLINYLYENGATYIALPMSLYVIKYSQERNVSGERVTTKSTLSNLERFFTITTNSGRQSINFTVES